MISVAMGEEDYRIVRSKSEKLFFSIGHIPLNILQQETVFKTEWHRMMYKEVKQQRLHAEPHYHPLQYLSPSKKLRRQSGHCRNT